MMVDMTGPRGGKVDVGLQTYALLAIESFSRQLGISRLRINIGLKFHHKLLIADSAEGFCESLNRRNFYIDCCLYGNWLSTLAHEMVHVKQFARDELSANLRRWKTRDHTNTEYWDQPWEKEARRLQSRLVAKFEEELSSQ